MATLLKQFAQVHQRGKSLGQNGRVSCVLWPLIQNKLCHKVIVMDYALIITETQTHRHGSSHPNKSCLRIPRFLKDPLPRLSVLGNILLKL